MEIIVFEKEAYYEMLAEMKQAMKEAVKQAYSEAKPDNDWIGPEEAKQLLRIKAKSTLQELRDQGKIEFSQHGRIIHYSRKSIMDFINKNRVKPYR